MELTFNNADAQASVNNMSNSNEQFVKTGKRAKRSVNPFWVTINRSRKIFEIQLDKSNELKLRCLGNQLGRENDPAKFYNDYMEQVNYLLDSNRFVQQCTNADVNPTTLATHIVFLGSATLHRVRENGIINSEVYGDINLYKDSFIPDNSQEFVKRIGR